MKVQCLKIKPVSRTHGTSESALTIGGQTLGAASISSASSMQSTLLNSPSKTTQLSDLHVSDQPLLTSMQVKSLPMSPGPMKSEQQIPKGIARYKCLACEKEWRTKNSRGSPKTCDTCGKTDVQPYEFIPYPKRMFGDFHCSCGSHWSSGCTYTKWDRATYKWVEYWQKCRRCGTEVYPSNIRPLQFTSGNASQKPHDSAACSMCQKHGDCRNLRLSEIEEGEWDDSTSVRSEASSISDLSEDQNLSDGTPVNSDEEAIDDMLSSKLKDLHMKK